MSVTEDTHQGNPWRTKKLQMWFLWKIFHYIRKTEENTLYRDPYIKTDNGLSDNDLEFQLTEKPIWYSPDPSQSSESSISISWKKPNKTTTIQIHRKTSTRKHQVFNIEKENVVNKQLTEFLQTKIAQWCHNRPLLKFFKNSATKCHNPNMLPGLISSRRKNPLKNEFEKKIMLSNEFF